jgi:hypothetical protein
MKSNLASILKISKKIILFVPISKITNLYVRCIPNIKKKNIKILFDSRMTVLT